MKASLFIVLFYIAATAMFAQNIVVSNPPFSVCSHPNVIIDKIELKDTETVLYMTVYQQQGQWIRISSDTYIRANGEKYVVKSADGIELSTETYPDSSGKIVFTLHFPAIDLSIQQIDFIESDCDNCFKIWGIELKPGVSAKREEVPDKIKNEVLIKEDGKSLEAPQLKYGEAIFKGQFLGYIPEMNWKIELYVDNPVTNIQEALETTVKDDGSFELKVPLVTTMQVLFRTAFYNEYILLSPDKETTLYVDLYQKSCQETGNEALKCPPAKYMYFGGANAEINNQMEDKNIKGIKRDLIDAAQDFNVILNMSAEQYKTYVLDKMNEAIEKLSQKNLTGKAYEFAVMDIRFTAIYMLIFADSNLEYAYRKAHNLDYSDKMTGYTEPVFDKAYYSFLKEMPFNNPLSLYSSYFGNMVNSSKYLDKKSIGTNTPSRALYQELINSGKLSPKEKEYAEYLQKEAMDSWSAEKQQDFKAKIAQSLQKLIETGKLDDNAASLVNELIPLCNDSKSDIISVVEKVPFLLYYLTKNELFSQEEASHFFDDTEKPDSIKESKFSDELKESFNTKTNEASTLFFKKERIRKTQSYLADILGTSQGIVFDMMTAQFYCDKFEENIPLTNDELKELAQLKNPFYSNYINQKNNELLAKIEENKNKKGYNIHDVPETDNEKLFAEILKPFEGKVILVDFWATWCGPCRFAMKEFEPAKERLKEKGVVFVYLTDESSPLAVWQNMIPDIPGEHFRLKNSQFKYLSKKFGVNGIPSYLILNKNGDQIYFKVAFEGSEKLEKILTDAI